MYIQGDFMTLGLSSGTSAILVSMLKPMRSRSCQARKGMVVRCVSQSASPLP